MEQDEKFNLRYRVGQSFTPATPINDRQLFAGRTSKVQQIIDAISQRGQHVVLYGERGVGKTSLSRVLASFFTHGTTILAPNVVCNSGDTFEDLWLRILAQVELTEEVDGIGFNPEAGVRQQSLADLLVGAMPTPDNVRVLLSRVAGGGRIFILIVDEFDRLSNVRDQKLFADTIKVLSDYAVQVTLLLVGVADTVESLISGHESVLRNLVQVDLPRMKPRELRRIVTDRLPGLELTITEEALDAIVMMSRGLPHYTHLLSQRAAWAAIDDEGTEIQKHHVKEAAKSATKSSIETVLAEYHKAIQSTRKDNMYADVLLACALAPCNKLGYFTPAAVRGPMRDVKHKSYEIAGFARHLAEFCKDTRGPVLEETGLKYQKLYRFRNPLMQSHVIACGVASDVISMEKLEEYYKEATGPDMQQELY